MATQEDPMILLPHVFRIADVAQLIVHFLPWLQYRQWIVECRNDKMQAVLCKWHEKKCCADPSYVKRNVVLKNNMRAIRFLVDGLVETNDWAMLCLYATSEMFEYMLRHARNRPSTHELALTSSKCWQLQLINDVLTIDPETQQEAFMRACVSQNTKLLHWMLNTMHWRVVVSKQFLCTNELWEILESSVLDGRLGWSNVDIMPPQLLLLQLSSMDRDTRQRMFHLHSDKLEYAALLWKPDYAFVDLFHFHVDAALSVYDGYYALASSWREVHIDRAPQDMQTCENALAFAQQSTTNIAFNEALKIHISRFLLERCDDEDRKWIFARCCLFGTPCIAAMIWSLSTEVMKTHLRPMLQQSYQCSNRDMLNFAFAKASQLILPHSGIWYHYTILLNNVIAWKFLYSIDVLSPGLVISMILRNSDGGITSEIGSLPVEFVSTLWSQYQQHFLEKSAIVLTSALRYENKPLIQFLAHQVSFKMNDTILCDHIVPLARMGLVHIIANIQHCHSINYHKLCKAYVQAHDVCVAQTLLRMFPFDVINTDEFASHITNQLLTNVDLCVFFVQNNFISFDRLYHLFVPNPQEQQFDAQLQTLIGRFYADVDVTTS